MEELEECVASEYLKQGVDDLNEKVGEKTGYTVYSNWSIVQLKRESSKNPGIEGSGFEEG